MDKSDQVERWSTTSEATYPERSRPDQDYQFHYIFIPASN